MAKKDIILKKSVFFNKKSIHFFGFMVSSIKRKKLNAAKCCKERGQINMVSKKHFIKATEEYNTFEKNMPEYYFRRSFFAEQTKEIKITVAVCGFYKLYFNGKDITKGFLSPYINNTDDFIYYDEYMLKAEKGENVIGVILGNGFQNNPGGHIWHFDEAKFRSAPMFSLSVSEKCGSEEKILLESDSNFKIKESPIRFDDYRFGEFYDANFEIEGWNETGFDDSSWENALLTLPPKGELCLSDVSPITKETEIQPLDIIPCGDGFIYDFGISNAGVCRLNVNGKKGQKIELTHADSLKDGDLNLAQIWFEREHWERDKKIVHKDTYVCKGTGNEIYQPSFTYHGFRYVRVDGITKEQATKDLLTYLVYHTELKSLGDFKCSDETVNKLQEITRRSIVSNFHHFPTDCPQREKNGWTADAALSSEAALLNFDPERNYRQWMKNVCKTQLENGSLPGIVPTGGWGYEWGNGPAWDCVLAVIPYFTYIYRGETEMILNCSKSFTAYLKYLRTRCDENGLLAIGLGDWCYIGGGIPKARLIATDSITTMDIASKIADMFAAVGMKSEEEFARNEAEKYRTAIRKELIDFDTMLFKGNCQTEQAMGLYYGIFEENEENKAFEMLLKLISDANDHIDVGVLGGRVLFHVLTKFGYSDLALKMITRPDFPSFGNWLERGATTLWEDFRPNSVSSMNHHFWGDISAWFIKCIAGINVNPEKNNANSVKIKPSFVSTLEYVSAYHILKNGKVSVEWKRENGAIILEVKVPNSVSAVAETEKGYAFEDGSTRKNIKTGVYKIIDVTGI